MTTREERGLARDDCGRSKEWRRVVCCCCSQCPATVQRKTDPFARSGYWLYKSIVSVHKNNNLLFYFGVMNINYIYFGMPLPTPPRHVYGCHQNGHEFCIRYIG